jgi:hypothetical protein
MDMAEHAARSVLVVAVPAERLTEGVRFRIA